MDRLSASSPEREPQPLAELVSRFRGGSRVRIPPCMDVPLSDRVRRLLDTPPMRRLASLSQLGLVALVYPGATHTRWEHSLGVYAAAIGLLDQLGSWRRTAAWFVGDVDDPRGEEAFLVASIVHDVGHWPFCHPIEDMGTSCPIKHERRVEDLLCDGPLAEALRRDWRCTADDVMAILCPETWAARTTSGDCGLNEQETAFWASCLSGPIDIDKFDYLQRDSLHAGVPYGRHFDPARLAGALCAHPSEPKLAISVKGRTAAEMMVFGRYVMFSEVYWHHAVRSATAMLQRALFEMSHRGPTRPGNANTNGDDDDDAQIDWTAWVDQTEAAWVESFREASRRYVRAHPVAGAVVGQLADGLFGPTRCLYKRIAEFNVESQVDLHRRLARRPYWWLVECSRPLAESIGEWIGQAVDPACVLIDAPPVKLEVDINIDVVQGQDRIGTLGDVSPVASVLANRQFDDHVKRVRVFVPGWLRDRLAATPGFQESRVAVWLHEAIQILESEMA